MSSCQRHRLRGIARPRLLAGVTIIGLIAAALYLLPISDWYEVFLLWVQDKPLLGRALFLLIAAVSPVFLMPGSVIVMSGGFLFGLVQGAIMSSIGTLLGAVAAFLVGRYLAREWVEEHLQGHPRFQAVDSALKVRGFTVVTLTRLSLVIPFNLLNYAYGLSGIGLNTYSAATWIGSIPAVILYTYLGSTARELSELLAGNTGASSVGQVMIVLGLAATIAVVVLLHRTATRILRKHGVAD